MPTSTKLRATYAILLAATLIFTLYEELHLRRWLFHKYGSSSVLAGSLPNFLAVVILSLAVMVVKFPQRNREIIRTILAVVVGLTLYEVAQIWMPHRVFDWNDIAATLLGGIFVWLLIILPRQMILPRSN
ncbi:VanZ family protein [Acidicapsa ligni]|uniref:VanZ family protein n=1 Tax=Acidicapsa ligni TaxID=542300 RepID=UPI0021DF43F7|nr:VanZ family protein [Acidicapsa ligni]